MLHPAAQMSIQQIRHVYLPKSARSFAVRHNAGSIPHRRSCAALNLPIAPSSAFQNQNPDRPVPMFSFLKTSYSIDKMARHPRLAHSSLFYFCCGLYSAPAVHPVLRFTPITQCFFKYKISKTCSDAACNFHNRQMHCRLWASTKV